MNRVNYTKYKQFEIQQSVLNIIDSWPKSRKIVLYGDVGYSGVLISSGVHNKKLQEEFNSNRFLLMAEPGILKKVVKLMRPGDLLILEESVEILGSAFLKNMIFGKDNLEILIIEEDKRTINDEAIEKYIQILKNE